MRSKCVLNKNNKNTNPDPRTQTQKFIKEKNPNLNVIFRIANVPVRFRDLEVEFDGGVLQAYENLGPIQDPVTAAPCPRHNVLDPKPKQIMPPLPLCFIIFLSLLPISILFVLVISERSSSSSSSSFPSSSSSLWF